MIILLAVAAAALGVMPQPITPLRSDLSTLPSLSDLAAVTGTRVALTVSATGSLLRCDVVRRSTSARLDRVGCARLMASARFRPALDESGVPVAAIVDYAFAMNGSLPPSREIDYALPVASQAVRTLRAGLVTGADTTTTSAVADARVVTDAQGRITSCVVAASSGTPALDRLVCPGIAAEVLAVAQTASGAPLRAMRLVSVGFATGDIARRID